MSKHIRSKRGLNIPIKGEAHLKISKTVLSDIIAVKPTDYKLVIPKLLVKDGDSVKSGSPIFCDKKRPEIVFTSPVSGKVKEIVRGEKRKILQILIEADKVNEYLQFNTKDPIDLVHEEIVKILLESGLWTTIKQRPYGIIADPTTKPKAIFISAFDSSPLAPDLDFTLKGEFENMQRAVNVLNKLTAGGIHMSFSSDNYASSPFHRLEKIFIHSFHGPHPAGNVGVQINNINPINKGEIIWTLDLYALAAIGKLFAKGIYDVSKVIAVTGPRVKEPSYIKCTPGMPMSEILEYVSEDKGEVRFVSGNVLTGESVGKDGYLGFYHNQITLIPEGNYYEFAGWANPLRSKKFSFSKAYFSYLFPKKKYSVDTNLNGGERAFVMNDVYSKVLPMDIFPTHLLKAILAEDIDKMEELGIYEVIEEDFALCEYVCPSKIEIQEILSKGIELMVKEMA